MIDTPRSHRGGYTLIELLIVVVIIGIIATIIIPMFLDALQRSKQKRTMAEMRLVGNCWMDWLTDHVGAGAAGSKIHQYDLADLDLITADELLESLYPTSSSFYCTEVPILDGWATRYEYYVNPNSLLSAKVMAIRSAGRDATWEDELYSIGPFTSTDYDRDILWADGLFMQYPAGMAVVNTRHDADP